MDNFSEKLNQLLQNPESLKQMMEMASALSSSLSSNSNTDAQQLIPKLDSQALNQVQHREEKQQALIQALLPYLRPSRQARLQRAVELAHLSQLAGAAIQSRQPAVPKKEEQLV